jgi:hypothetical protein
VVGEVLQIAIESPITVLQAARQAGMDLKDFLSLNYDLAKMSVVPRGTLIWVKRR